MKCLSVISSRNSGGRAEMACAMASPRWVLRSVANGSGSALLYSGEDTFPSASATSSGMVRGRRFLRWSMAALPAIRKSQVENLNCALNRARAWIRTGTTLFAGPR